MLRLVTARNLQRVLVGNPQQFRVIQALTSKQTPFVSVQNRNFAKKKKGSQNKKSKTDSEAEQTPIEDVEGAGVVAAEEVVHEQEVVQEVVEEVAASVAHEEEVVEEVIEEVIEAVQDIAHAEEVVEEVAQMEEPPIVPVEEPVLVHEEVQAEESVVPVEEPVVAAVEEVAEEIIEEPVVVSEPEAPIVEETEAIQEEAPVVEEIVEEVVEQVHAVEEIQLEEVEGVSTEHFEEFSVGDVKEIKSTPDHKPPMLDDTIEGRYAGVLFSSASQSEALYLIYEDITYISSLYDNSETFRLFTKNAGVGSKEINMFNDALNDLGTFHPLTIKFLEVLAENKRLTYIRGIADRYVKLYQLFNKEEKITIISAEELSSSEQSEVLEALKANPTNQGKEFQIEFTIDASIKGGLQMYTETEFMDMSLSSRVDKLKSDINKLIE